MDILDFRNKIVRDNNFEKNAGGLFDYCDYMKEIIFNNALLESITNDDLSLLIESLNGNVTYEFLNKRSVSINKEDATIIENIVFLYAYLSSYPHVTKLNITDILTTIFHNKRKYITDVIMDILINPDSKISLIYSFLDTKYTCYRLIKDSAYKSYETEINSDNIDNCITKLVCRLFNTNYSVVCNHILRDENINAKLKDVNSYGYRENANYIVKVMMFFNTLRELNPEYHELITKHKINFMNKYSNDDKFSNARYSINRIATYATGKCSSCPKYEKLDSLYKGLKVLVSIIDILKNDNDISSYIDKIEELIESAVERIMKYIKSNDLLTMRVVTISFTNNEIEKMLEAFDGVNKYYSYTLNDSIKSVLENMRVKVLL